MIARLERRAAVRIAGPDWRPFLQGLLTQEVEGLRPGEMRFGALLTPQGRLLFDLFVDCDGEDGAQAGRGGGAAGRAGPAAEPLSPARQGGGRGRPGAGVRRLEGPARGRGLAAGSAPGRARLPAHRRDRPGPNQAPNADEDAYDAWRLGLGVPDPAQDCKPDATYPIEADFDLLNGVDFKKGCFVGQETTSRMKRRGQVKSRMLPIEFDGPAPAWGAEVLAGSLRAGEVLSGRAGRAMALLRLDRIEAAALTVDGRPVKVVRPAWFETEA